MFHSSAAPIQTTLIGLPWQVVQNGEVIGHYASQRRAADTSTLYPGSTVRFAS